MPDPVWLDRLAAAGQQLLPWIEQTIPLAGKTVLEYGCGNGAVSCAVALYAQRLIGYDIDPGAVAFARSEAERRGLGNCQFEARPVDQILAEVEARAGQVDVFLLYAVLEHMTVTERLEILKVARKVVNRDGVIVVCETPNRLVYGDPHSSQLPFYAQLPDDLALAYYDRSPRPYFRERIAAEIEKSPEAALEGLTRFGRAVSYHEFELAFGDLTRHVLASNYELTLFPRRPVMADELLLAGWLARERPDLSPVWSRYWIDVILAPEPLSETPKFVWPWSMETVGADRAYFTRWQSIAFERHASLPVTLPRATRRLVVGLHAEEGEIDLEVRGSQSSFVVTQSIAGPAVHQRYASVELPALVSEFALRLSRPAHLAFLGYEA